MIIFKTKRLNTREFVLSDSQLVYKYHKEDSIKNELPDEVFESLEYTRELIAKFRKNYKTRDYPLIYAVTMKDTDKLIGNIGLSLFEDGKVEIGYSISEQFQGNGFAKEVVLPFLKWSFKYLGLTEIFAIVKKRNTASIKVLEYAGFEFVKQEAKDMFGKSNIPVITYRYLNQKNSKRETND